MKRVIVALLIAVGVNGLARAQEPTPLYFEVVLSNDTSSLSSSSLKGVVLRAIEKNISSTFVRSYNKDETNAIVVFLTVLGIKTRMGTGFGVAFSVNARIQNYTYAKLIPIILAETGHVGWDPDSYSLDFIRSSIDQAVAGTFVEYDELTEVRVKIIDALRILSNQQEEGN